MNPILDRINASPSVEGADKKKFKEAEVMDGVDMSKFRLTTEVPTTEVITEQETQQAMADAKNVIVENIDRTSQFVKQTEDNIKKTDNITSIVVGATEEAAKAKGIISAVKENADLKTQNRTNEIFELAGGEAEQARLIARQQEDELKLEKIIDERTEIANTEYTGFRLIDDIINNFNLGLTRTKYKVAEQELNQTNAEIATATATTDAFAKQNATVAKTRNLATVEANTSLIANQGIIDSNNAKLSALNANARSYESVVNATGKQLDAYMSVARLEGEIEARAIQKERFEIVRQEMAIQLEDLPQKRERNALELKTAQANYDRMQQLTPLQIEQAQTSLAAAKFNLANDKTLTPLQITTLRQQIARNEAMTPTAIAAAELNLQKAQQAIVDEEATRANFAQKIKEGQAIAGVPIDSDDKAIMNGLTLGGAVGKRYEQFLLIGMAGTGQIASNPYDSAKTISILAPNGLQEETKGSKLLEEITEETAKVHAAAGGAPRDEEGQKGAFNRVADQLQEVLASDIKLGDDSNPYHAPSMDVLAGFRAVAESDLYQKVLKASGKKEFDPDFLLSQATAAIKAKVLTPEQAAYGVTKLAQAAMEYNNKMGMFDKYGLKNQFTYNVQVKDGLNFSSSAIRAMFNPVDAMNMKESVLVKERQKLNLANMTEVQSMIVKKMSRGSDKTLNLGAQ